MRKIEAKNCFILQYINLWELKGAIDALKKTADKYTSSQFLYFIICEVSPTMSSDVDIDKSGEGEGERVEKEEEVGDREGRVEEEEKVLVAGCGAIKERSEGELRKSVNTLCTVSLSVKASRMSSGGMRRCKLKHVN